MTGNYRYTCNDYRLEMILLSLRQRLSKGDYQSEAERKEIQKEIRHIESQMGMV